MTHPTETDKILNDIRAYLRTTAAIASRPNAARAIDTMEKATIYSKLDGFTSQSNLEQVVGVPQQTISSWLSDFAKEGLASPPDEFYKAHRALYTLQELGVSTSALKSRGKSRSKDNRVQVVASIQSPSGET